MRRRTLLSAAHSHNSRDIVSRVNLDHDFCLVLADFGQNGQAFLETDPGDATFERAVTDIIDGQVDHVLAVVQFNPVEGQARDVTEEVAQAVSERVCREGDYPNEAVRRLLDSFGLAYPAAETSVWPRSLTPAQSERNVSSLAEQLERARSMPKRPAAGSVSTLQRSARPETSPSKKF
jgi:hypothetical protein